METITRDIQYELMDESHSRKSDEQNEAIYESSEEFHDYRNDMENRQETKPENNLKDTDWEYSGRVWPLPKHQIFKELVQIIWILDGQLDVSKTKTLSLGP